jgi:hypothetical protein
MKTLITFSTAWGPKFGGINSFNVDFLKAFAGVNYHQARTICVVPMASVEEMELAAGEQITLISLAILDSKVLPPIVESAAWEKIKEKVGLFDLENTIWLGHDSITGPIALAAAQKRGGRCAVINHMTYASYEAFCETSEIGARKEDEQRNLFKDVDIPLAVGPLLRDALADMLDADTVPMLIPGLPEITVRKNPKKFKGFISGRLVDDARKVKQAHLGIAAFADAIRQADENPVLPDPLRGENEPKLILRGVSFESGRNSGDGSDALELELKLFSEKYAKRAFPFHALPFTVDREKLFEELASATLAMMPSWHEGFGLVAWEAIGAGVPVIISRKSGVFQFLNELDDGIFISLLISIDVGGSSENPFFTEKDQTTLSNAIVTIAKSPAIFKQKAARLRQSLAVRFSWAECARQFTRAIEWPELLQETEFNVSDTQKPIPDNLTNGILEMPSSYWIRNTGLSDSKLLRAEEAIIPFDKKRDPFLQEQMGWVKDFEFPMAIRLITGPGGVGKTRLALEMCERLNIEGWEVGFLRGDCDIGQARELAVKISSSKKQYFIVLDYAETRQVILLALLSEILEQKNKSIVRILLIARDGGEWWNLLSAKESRCEAFLTGMASTGPFEMPNLHPLESERKDAYQIALNTFAIHLSIPAPQHFPQLEEEHFSHPLYIQMAALIALRGERPKSAEALTRTLVGHERRYWRKSLTNMATSDDVVEENAALLMVLATLANGIATSREIEKVWNSAGGDARLLKPLFKSLIPLYPGRQGLQGWKPDLLGEALIGQVLLGDGIAVLDAVLGRGDRWLRRNCFTVLARMLRNRTDISDIIEEALLKNFVRCIDDVVATCLDTPSILPTIVEKSFSRLPKVTRWQAVGLLEKHVRHDTLPLTGLDVLVSKVALEKISKFEGKEPLDYKVNRAIALSNLAIALDRDGQISEALDVAMQALEINERLVAGDAGRYEERLAGILNTCTNLLAQQGRAEDALRLSARGLVIRRQMVKDGRGELELANSLNNYSACLSKFGKVEEVIAVTAETVHIARKLAKVDSKNYNWHLALFLVNYAAALLDRGSDDDALVASQEALEIHRELAKVNPARYEHDYARSLGAYASYLSTQGAVDDALIASTEALEINKRLARAKPNRFEADFAAALENQSNRLIFKKKWHVALEASKDAVLIRRRLAAVNPERFGIELGTSLSNHALCLLDNGLISDSLEFGNEAILLKEIAASDFPERYEGDLAMTLGNQSLTYASNGEWAKALELCSRALEIYLKCKERVPERFSYAYEQTRLAQGFWEWLANGIVPDIKKPPGEFITARNNAALNFQYLSYLGIFSMNPVLVEDAISGWDQLNSAQKHSWGDLYLLLSVVSTGNSSASASLEWRDNLKNYSSQRGGLVPRWIYEAALRNGVNAQVNPTKNS